jgi:hypothetical protein
MRERAARDGGLSRGSFAPHGAEHGTPALVSRRLRGHRRGCTRGGGRRGRAGRERPDHDRTAGGCQLGNGVEHVIELTFDNVHFFRDNPNVPSDLELMPHLMNFLQGNGALLSNMHTPLIAHTAYDSLTTYTGLYGDRHGMPISNSYRTYNPDGTTDPAGSFVYWTDPVFDTLATPNAGHDTNQSMVYSADVPASGTTPNTVSPAPWVPFTRPSSRSRPPEGTAPWVQLRRDRTHATARDLGRDVAMPIEGLKAGASAGLVGQNIVDRRPLNAKRPPADRPGRRGSAYARR